MSFGKLHSSISIGIDRYFFQKDHSTFQGLWAVCYLLAHYLPWSSRQCQQIMRPPSHITAVQFNTVSDCRLMGVVTSSWAQPDALSLFSPLTHFSSSFSIFILSVFSSVSHRNNPASWITWPSGWLKWGRLQPTYLVLSECFDPQSIKISMYFFTSV